MNPVSEQAESRRASAPGKVMLAGEYAILEGAEAALIAVDRRVSAWIEPGRELSGPFLAATRDEIIAELGADHPAARAAAHIVADSDSLCASDGTKLGLGSSAAVTVAATACALGADASRAGQELDRALAHRVAHAAHGRAQEALGARGSGADIAASVYGGAIAVCMAPASAEHLSRTSSPRIPGRSFRLSPENPLAVRQLDTDKARNLVFLWTGKAADTPSLVARVRELRQSDPASYQSRVTAIAGAADAVITALEPSADSAALVASIAVAAEAVAELGRAAGVDLETDAHRAIARLARAHDGTAKPTGAGAGDIAVAAFATPEAKAAFCADAWDSGLTLLDLAISEAGARLE